jgi:cold shock CspA family protein
VADLVHRLLGEVRKHRLTDLDEIDATLGRIAGDEGLRRERGWVKFWSSKSPDPFGYITPEQPERSEIRVTMRGIQPAGLTCLEKGQEVSFERGRTEAIHVKLEGSS